MSNNKVAQFPDKELEAQLKRYAASKEAKLAAEDEMLVDFSETEEESIVVEKDIITGQLEITEVDEE